MINTNNLFSKKELSLFNSQNPIFNEEQIKFINRKTPDSQTELKEDKNGCKYKSVKASYIKALLMMVTGGNYNFEVKSREIFELTKEVIVEARLTIVVNGKTFVREQIGQHHLTPETITVTENGKQVSKSIPSDIGNGYKSATTNALKKCASEFGFCWDIYNQERSDKKKESLPALPYTEQKIIDRLNSFLIETTTEEEAFKVYVDFLNNKEETPHSKNAINKHLKTLKKL